MTSSDHIQCEVCRTDVIPDDAVVTGPRGRGHWECVDPETWYAPEGAVRAKIWVAPSRAFGLPTFGSGTRVDVVVDRIAAGDDDASILADFDGLTADEVAIAHALEGALYEDAGEDDDEFMSLGAAIGLGVVAAVALFVGVIIFIGRLS